jgi:hypothetical protein
MQIESGPQGIATEPRAGTVSVMPETSAGPDTGRLAADPAGLVLDTNAVLDWLWFADPAMDALGRAIVEGRCAWWITRAMEGEVEHVMTHQLPPRPGRDKAAALLACRRWARRRPPGDGPLHHRLVCRDPDDQMFLDLALATGARWLLTRDRALLTLARRARPLGLEILAPRHWTPHP